MGRRLEGKRAIVTGAASGIGKAAAALFEAEGAAVVAADVDDADISDESAVQRLVATCVERHGGLDVLYANAGVTGPLAELCDLTADDWRRVIDVNLLGTFFCIKHAAAYMRDHGGGSIVCTASIAGLRSGAGPTPYSATKAGVISMVQTAAWQLSGTGVRVNAICPGLIETGMTREMFERARAAGKGDKIGQLNPTRRAGQPEEVARAALYLASDDSQYVNGHALVVDGGLSSSHPVMPGRMM